MNNEGYVIARNRARKEFFTSSSAYDRPVWTPVTEATVYLTAELAQKAAVKLATRGAYEARIVTLKEALTLDDLKMASARGDTVDKAPKMDIEIANADPLTVGAGDEMEVDVQPDGEGGMEMVAKDQGDACETCMHCPCTCDPDEDGVDDIVDAQINGEQPAPGEDMVGDEMDAMGDEMSGLDPARPRMESATMPGKPMADGAPTENKKIATDLPVAPVIKYKDAAQEADRPATDLTTSGAMAHEDKVKVPAEVMSDLRSTIADFTKCAELSNGRDDTKGSFCMTVVAAFEELEDLLKTGTVEAVKMAQVKMTSWMNPITSHLPVSVQKFIYMGGRKPTLKDLFDTKKQAARVVTEATDRLETERKEKLADHKQARAELMSRIREAEEEGDTAAVTRLKKSLAVTDGAIKNLSK
jgi:hypothetical protein